MEAEEILPRVREKNGVVGDCESGAIRGQEYQGSFSADLSLWSWERLM